MLSIQCSIRRPLLSCALLVCTALIMPVESIAQPAGVMAEQTANLAKFYGQDLNARCKTKLKVSIDAASFAAPMAEEARKSQLPDLFRQCGAPLRAVKEWCAKGFADLVNKQVTSFVCRYGTPKMTVAAGVLTFTTDWQAKTRSWAEKAVGSTLRDGDFGLLHHELMRDDKQRLKGMHSDTIKRHCKHNITSKIDWKSFIPQLDKRIADSNATPIYSLCGDVLKGLDRLCLKGHSALVQKQVKTFTCRLEGQKASSLSLKNGTLTVAVNASTRSYRDWISSRLGDEVRAGDFSVAQADFITDESQNFKRVFGDLVNQRCDAEIKWSIDWMSFKNEIDSRLAKQDDSSIYAACGVPLRRLADICADGKQAKVKKKIKSYHCAFGGAGKRALKLKKGMLSYSVDFSAKKPYGFVDKFLVKKRVIKKRPKPRQMSPRQARLLLRERISPKQQCRRRCDKVCRHASNRSRCKSRCRGACR